MNCLNFFLLCLFQAVFIFHAAGSETSGQILFLVKQGNPAQAIAHYRTFAAANHKHDFELLHQIGLGMLDYGYARSDPETQLLALFGASISANQEAHYLLEEGLKNRYPQIQLIALLGLAKVQNDGADQNLIGAMGSSQLIVRMEAAKQLALKKHPEAINQIESLMFKSPTALLPLYPPLIASIGNYQADRILRKLLHHPSSKVRLSVLLSIAKFHRDDFLPQLRQHVLQSHHGQQEACVYALGLFHDELSRTKLEKLRDSNYPAISLAAELALYRLGNEQSLREIEKLAEEGSLFAISVLGEIPEASDALTTLTSHKDPQIRINAALGLLNQKNVPPVEILKEILIRNRRDLAFVPQLTPGKTIKSWKVVHSASRLMEDDPALFQTHLKLKIDILESLKEISEPDFIEIAHQIYRAQENALVPETTLLLEELGTASAIECLKAHQQQLGAPLIRHYCNLALYRLHEPGLYGDQLKQWVKTQNKTPFLSLQKEINVWDLKMHPHALTPEQSSQLLIKAFESFAINADEIGIDVLLEAIATGHPKNKYALAGLLLRATN